MMRIAYLLSAILPITLLSACVAPAKYNWGNYDGSLYGYYQDPTRLDAHLTEMESIIRSSEQTSRKVAPGIHAEYGYFLMQSGKAGEAVAQFEKEKTDWPESGQLMSIMIRQAEARSTKSSTAKD
ncbi:DUF4810 domain-containing protein [Noviherbaspirillum suwonense]|jgi:hypothetical protein|nr:DUF4810 domain-containing protein [Noviherbaspirillum suwonense]